MFKRRSCALNVACEGTCICRGLKTHLKTLSVMQNRARMFAQVDICSTLHAGLSTRVFLDLWSKGAQGPKKPQVVHKPIVHAWTSKCTSSGYWQFLQMVLDVPLPVPACSPQFNWFSEYEWLQSSYPKGPWRQLKPPTPGEWKRSLQKKRQTTKIYLFLCMWDTKEISRTGW